MTSSLASQTTESGSWLLAISAQIFKSGLGPRTQLHEGHLTLRREQKQVASETHSQQRSGCRESELSGVRRSSGGFGKIWHWVLIELVGAYQEAIVVCYRK